MQTCSNIFSFDSVEYTVTGIPGKFWNAMLPNGKIIEFIWLESKPPRIDDYSIEIVDAATGNIPEAVMV